MTMSPRALALKEHLEDFLSEEANSFEHIDSPAKAQNWIVLQFDGDADLATIIEDLAEQTGPPLLDLLVSAFATHDPDVVLSTFGGTLRYAAAIGFRLGKLARQYPESS